MTKPSTTERARLLLLGLLRGGLAVHGTGAEISAPKTICSFNVGRDEDIRHVRRQRCRSRIFPHLSRGRRDPRWSISYSHYPMAQITRKEEATTGGICASRDRAERELINMVAGLAFERTSVDAAAAFLVIRLYPTEQGMKTKHKIAIAKVAYHAIHTIRAVSGRKDQGTFNRNGLRYNLDLTQGIDFSLYLLGRFEPTTSKALRNLIKPGFQVVDVGANVGAHTLNIARFVGTTGRVVACEPTDFAYHKLCRNITLNDDLVQRITPLQCFLGAPSQTELPRGIYSGWPLTGGHDLHPEHLGSEQSTLEARSCTFDEVVESCKLNRVDLVKLDVDGFECDVLSGARQTMAKFRPIFVMELAPYVLEERGHTLSEMLRFFQDLKYTFYNEKDMSLISNSVKDLENMITSGESMNVVAR